MSTNYPVSVWKRAMMDAEAEVMRATATPSGGRLQNEELIDYVERTRRIQGAAIARWMTAKEEMEAAAEKGIKS